MNKYFAITAVASFLILASCSNDEIPVSETVTIKVDPHSVVSSLIEYNTGDLSSVSSDEKLYVDLYIYNEAGNLIDHESTTFNDYTHIMTIEKNLSSGKYTMVATSHIEYNDGTKFWEFSDQDKLSTFTVTDQGYIGGSAKILGITVQNVEFSSSVKDITINIKCAGAVALVDITNWNVYSDVISYGLLSNKSCDYLKIDINNSLEYSYTTSNDYNYWMAKWNYDDSYSGAIGYIFMFPFNSIKMTFAAVTNSNTYYEMGESIVFNAEVEHTYFFEWDVETDETGWWDFTDVTSEKYFDFTRLSTKYNNNVVKSDLGSKRMASAL